MPSKKAIEMGRRIRHLLAGWGYGRYSDYEAKGIASIIDDGVKEWRESSIAVEYWQTHDRAMLGGDIEEERKVALDSLSAALAPWREEG
jgi:hypothetical protein